MPHFCDVLLTASTLCRQIKDADRSFKQTVAGFLQDMTLLDSAAADQDDQLELLDEVIR